ncbi:MAG: SDR family NAD(P)-dependent oxidoreductase [Caulobacteraceae bacterium]|nr:SDR family NAD(P)-dependent oxidoreductase [Caulobacteraceae bacterium]
MIRYAKGEGRAACRFRHCTAASAPRAGSVRRAVALVTGASSGIGAAVVRQFADVGASVVFTDIIEPASPPHGRVRFIRAAATIEADAERAVAEALAAFGRLDIAINHVGNFGAETGLSPARDAEHRAQHDPRDARGHHTRVPSHGPDGDAR